MNIGTNDNAARFFTTMAIVSLWAGILVPTVAGQIVLDREYFESLAGEQFDATEYDAEDPAALQGVVDATGENATYDFTAASYVMMLEGRTQYYELPADLPGEDDPRFEGATHAASVAWEASSDDEMAEDSTAWGYFESSDEGWDFHGLIYLTDIDDDGEQDSLTFSYEPGLRQYAFPVEYGASWETAAAETLSVFGLTFGDSVRYEYEVEGYGELVTSQGSEPALRIRETQHQAVGTDTASTTTYLNFETRGELTAVIELDDEGNPVAAWYTVLERASTATEERAEIPAGYELAQSYPNPFNPSTTIRYSLPDAARVTLEVMDPLGRTVRVLVDADRPAGTHEVRFDGSGLPSGLYMYRLQAGAFETTRSMMLVK